MQQVFTLEHLLKTDNSFYIGECFLVDINERLYSFVKGNIKNAPRKFEHKLYNLKTVQSAAYIIQDSITGKMYVGSTCNIYERMINHKSSIFQKTHVNKRFEELLKSTSIDYIDLILIFTNTREEAYDVEQLLLDRYKGSELLLNTALDVKAPMKGCNHTEHTKQLQSNFHKTDEKAINQFKEILEAKKRKIMVHGVEYESITQAGIESHLSESAIRRSLRNKRDPNIYYISDNASPLENRTLPEWHKQRLSNFRKTDPAAIKQFNSIKGMTSRKILLNGVLYNSVTEAVQKTGICESLIHTHLRLTGGKKDDIYVLNYTPREPKRVSIGGKIYSSISIAARELNNNEHTLRSRMRSSKCSDHFFLPS